MNAPASIEHCAERREWAAARSHPGLIVHADEALIVAEKPAGLLSVPAQGKAFQDCLARRVQVIYPDALIAHRLDMATSGLMLLARGPEMLRQMNLDFEQRMIGKRYVALAHGRFEADSGTIDLPIAPDPENRPRQVVDFRLGRRALTHYRVLDSGWRGTRAVTRLELKPVTGRTHQLRVHLRSIGHPILGDPLYAPADGGHRGERMHLHAAAIALIHPRTRVPIGFESAVPF